MAETEHVDPLGDATPSIARRRFLQGAVALGSIVGAAPALAQAPIQVWEEGEPQCRVTPEAITPTYALDEALLIDFLRVSEALTGVRPLDRHLGARYLERYATHPQLSLLLPRLLHAFRDLGSSDAPASDADIEKNIMQNTSLRPAAEQLIYVWYVSAFFLPRTDDPSKSTWVYGSPEEYERGLIWSTIRAHAPMTRGGPYGYWADAPSL